MDKKLKQKIESGYSQLQYHKKVLEDEKNYKLKKIDEISATADAQKLLQLAAATVQQRVHEKISKLVTRCLKAVFSEDNYEFKIKFEQKRGKTEASLLLLKNGIEEDPLEEDAGGVLDVTAFALRISCLLLQTPKKRRLLVLDEPFRYVSIEYKPRVRELLKALVKELNLQIIMVTHDPTFQLGKVINFNKELSKNV